MGRCLASEPAEGVEGALVRLLDEVICERRRSGKSQRSERGKGRRRTDIEREGDDHDDDAPREEKQSDEAKATVVRCCGILEEAEDWEKKRVSLPLPPPREKGKGTHRRQKAK